MIGHGFFYFERTDPDKLRMEGSGRKIIFSPADIRIEPGMAGCESRMPPLCFAVPACKGNVGLDWPC